MSLQSDVVTVFEASAGLMAVLTGGVYAQDEVSEISRQSTPAAYDSNKELKPCALVTERTETPRGGIDHAGQGIAVQTSLEIYFYERSGYENIAAAMAISFPLLNGQKIGARTWRIEFNNEIKNGEDQALNVPLGMQRWIAVRRRV